MGCSERTAEPVVYGVTDELVDWSKTPEREDACERFVERYAPALGLTDAQIGQAESGGAFEVLTDFQDPDFGGFASGPFAAVRRVAAGEHNLGLAYCSTEDDEHAVLGVDVTVSAGIPAWAGDSELPAWIGERAWEATHGCTEGDWDAACDQAILEAVDQMLGVLREIFGAGELRCGFHRICELG